MQELDPHRYARQLALPGFGEAAQARLMGSSVLLVGLGGLGSPVAGYLAAAGVGQLAINDFDTVHQSNLHRQTLYDEGDIGARKAIAAARRLERLNSATQLRIIDERLDLAGLTVLAGKADLVLDCTDNFSSRRGINAACVHQGKPLVSGAAAGMDGHVAVFPCDRAGPCYQCFVEDVGDNFGDCEGNGILGPVTGVVGSLMAVEAIKVLTGFGNALAGRVAIYDGLNAEWKTLRLRRKPDCAECGGESKERNVD